MTQNLYLGADLAPLMAARTTAELGDALEKLLRRLGESDAPGRIAASARLIEEAGPDLVGLQEVARWEHGGSVVSDFGELLLAELGDRYFVAGEWHPTRAPGSRRPAVEIGNLVLARRGMSLEPSSGDYWGKLLLNHPLLGEVGITRGWVAVDGEIEGRRYRLVNTHLEATDPGVEGAAVVQAAQAAELAADAASVIDPVIVVGDLNSDPRARGVEPTASRDNLVRAGFADAWAILRPREPGLTWRLGDEIADPGAELGARLDVVLTRGAVRPVEVEVLGADPGCRTASGRWPSDHIAVVATVELA